MSSDKDNDIIEVEDTRVHNMTLETDPDSYNNINKPKTYRYLLGTVTQRYPKQGHQAANKELYKMRRSWDRNQVSNMRKAVSINDKAIYNYSKSVFVGAAHKAENSSLKTENSKVLGLIFNPLDIEAFERLEDMYVNDPTAQQNIRKFWGLVLGNEFKLTLADTKTYDNDEDKNNAYEQILKHPEYTKARDKCSRILEKIHFKENYELICILGNIFGRGAAEVIRDTETNEPKYINVLYSQLLGDPVLDKYHQLIGVEYEDLPENEDKFKKLPGSINDEHQPAFPINKLIYYTHNDVPVTIGGRYYGIGMESIIDASDTKRIILQNQLKEWVSKSHTGQVILTTDEPIPQEELDAIAVKLSTNQGGFSLFNYNVAVQSVSMPTNIEQLEKILDMLNREMLRGIDIISPLGGYEHVQNFASIAKTIVVWLASTLNPMRIRHKQIMKEQFIDNLFQTCLFQQGQIILEDPETYELKLYHVTYPEDKTPRQALEEINKFVKDEPDFNLLEEYTFSEQSLPVAELMIDIDLPKFSDFTEMGDKILSWVRERMMTKKKGLELVGHEDEIDDIKLLDQQAEEKQEELMNAGIMTDAQGKPIPNFRSAAVQEEVLSKKGGNGKVKDEIDPKFKDPKSRTRADTESINKREAKKQTPFNRKPKESTEVKK